MNSIEAWLADLWSEALTLHHFEKHYGALTDRQRERLADLYTATEIARRWLTCYRRSHAAVIAATRGVPSR
jgi:hypothetical protein